MIAKTALKPFLGWSMFTTALELILCEIPEKPNRSAPPTRAHTTISLSYNLKC